MSTPVNEPEFIIVENVEETIYEVVDAPPGPPGTDGPSVHWANQPPEPSDGNVGDFWVVTD